MEGVFDVYSRPYNAQYLVVCMDEKPVQFFDDARKGFCSSKSAIQYHDNEYIRNGTGCIFLFTEPLNGWRYADSQERRTKTDWAQQIDWLLTEQYPAAKKMLLVMDNLNTHSLASLYKTFEPRKAFSLASRLEIHYTSKHGSWPNIAEIELSALGRQSLNHRKTPDMECLRVELKPWCQNRSQNQRGVDWRFSTDDAGIKLKHFYPIINI